mmetsp:Transcript_16546/g.34773  ORF Transcript_16546/g.34773 Transcript_16546/m.34773 type:complete len:97 (-) Transcript_16546:235-525(-)
MGRRGSGRCRGPSERWMVLGGCGFGSLVWFIGLVGGVSDLDRIGLVDGVVIGSVKGEQSTMDAICWKFGGLGLVMFSCTSCSLGIFECQKRDIFCW